MWWVWQILHGVHVAGSSSPLVKVSVAVVAKSDRT